MSREWFFDWSRGRTPRYAVATRPLRAPGRRFRRGMIVALVRNKYRGEQT